MRSVGYTLHHSLTLEASTIVKQALTLARRRGHAQVTPLHVASAMLSSPSGLLKQACLQSHSHPLQCKALELCFNVALNRLPTSVSTPLLSPQSHLPSLSNALVAAFKRAQAHQRRGSIESHQQPILALKVEIQQLVISVLDDPSVSRVMREAGFSSTQVKINVEHIKEREKEIEIPILGSTRLMSSLATTTNITKTGQNSDVMSVLEAMMSKKTKNTIIIGSCSSTNESVIRGVIEKFDRKEVPHDMKHVQFISVPLLSLKNVSKQEFELKLGELRSLVKSHVSKGIVLYLGDLNWVSDFWSKYGDQRNVFFCGVEYMIMELSRLICVNEESRRLWLMGFATFQTYEKCKIGRPCLESLWNLHPLTLPAGNLALTLSLDSGMHDQVKKEAVEDHNWLFGIKKQLVCCSDCSENFKKEAEAVRNEFMSSSSSSRLPSWLQHYKDENIKQLQESDKIKDLCKKWNSICASVHKRPHFLEKVFNISSSSPSSSTSLSSNSQKKIKIKKTTLNLQYPTIFEPNRIFDQYEVEVSKPELLSNPNSSPNSASSSQASDHLMHKFDELDSDSLKIALEEKVPHQRHIIPDIITTILKNREEGVMRSSWLLFLGGDHDGKEIVAKEISKAVFGCDDENFISISRSSLSSKSACSSEEVVSKSKKRARNVDGGSVFDRFLEAVRDNPSRVLYVEDVDQLDYRCLKAFEQCMKDGIFFSGDGEEVVLKDAIVIFSCESMKREKEEREKSDDEEDMQCGVLDLNIATDDDHNEDGISSGILDAVDMQVVFNVQVM
ncbi:hypothetical protein ACS0TY_000760 [Phlomoides rotata]